LIRDTHRLAFRLDGWIDHLLLDEFQDTSLDQWHVVQPLAERITKDPKHSFFCVGDTKQAIYGWRGGNAEIFDALPHQLTNLVEASLDMSFRSAKPVIDVVNQVFKGGITQHPKLDTAQNVVQQWCDQFQTHTTAKSDLAGYVSLETPPEPEEEGRSANDVLFEYTADRVAELTSLAPGHSIGILVRRNAAVGRLIYELHKRHIPASEEGGNPLTDSAAVRLILSLVKLADHPGDTVARCHVAHSPLGAVLQYTDADDPSATKQLARRVRRSLLVDGYGEAIDAWTRPLVPSCNHRELNRLQRLVQCAYDYQATATLRTDDFIQYIETSRISDPTGADVRVMTVHQSKGLQFDTVILPELEGKLVGQPNAFAVCRPDPTGPIDCVCRYVNADQRLLFPDWLQQMFDDANAKSVSESLCVLYVAMTRAVHALHMIVTPSRKTEKSLPKTYAGLLRAALTDGTPAHAETTLFECGDREWYRRHRAEQTTHDSEAVAKTALELGTESQPITVRLAASTSRRHRGLELTSPTKLVGSGRVRVADILSTKKNTTALRRGTLMHAWFEQVTWLEEGTPSEATLRQVAGSLSCGPLNLEEQFEQFQSMLHRPTVADLLCRGHYQKKWPASDRWEVHNERPFAIRQGNTVVQGMIDRLVLIYDAEKLIAADIIDFKTDTIKENDPAALADKVKHYRPQMEAYRAAVARMTGLKNSPQQISARLLFVSPGIVADVL